MEKWPIIYDITNCFLTVSELHDQNFPLRFLIQKVQASTGFSHHPESNSNSVTCMDLTLAYIYLVLTSVICNSLELRIMNKQIHSFMNRKKRNHELHAVYTTDLKETKTISTHICSPLNQYKLYVYALTMFESNEMRGSEERVSLWMWKKIESRTSMLTYTWPTFYRFERPRVIGTLSSDSTEKFLRVRVVLTNMKMTIKYKSKHQGHEQYRCL